MRNILPFLISPETRMRNILPILISPEQAGFVKGRSIQDNILLAMELLQSIDKRCRGCNVAIKLDMMKAFDRVAWPFLKALLLKFGFSTFFVNLIMQNLTATRFSVLVNGVSSGFFQPSRGVKQGDPLSPLLFILTSEGLSRALVRKVGTGMIQPYKNPSAACPIITHLAFADDILIFASGSRKSLQNIKATLQEYEQASGQKINFSKSFFVTSKFASTARINTITRELGMHRHTIPFKYLGVNLFKGRNKSFYYQHILDGIDKRLLGWQRKLLSTGGRIILIKHVLSTIPLYSLASIQLPKGVIHSIEQRMANFFWGSNQGHNKRHWTSWSKLCFPEKEGGLGFRSLPALQSTFAAKLWFSYCKGGTIWSDYMRILHPNPNKPSSYSDSITWRRMKSVSSTVEDNITFLEDELIWQPSTLGSFTFDTAYNLFRPICPFCWNENASLEHCMRSCSSIIEIWIYFANLFNVNLGLATSVRTTCHVWWLSAEPEDGWSNVSATIRKLMPCFILWNVWKKYNTLIYEGGRYSQDRIIWEIKNDFLAFSVTHPFCSSKASDQRFIEAGLVTSFTNPRPKKTLWIKWQHPPIGRLKLNSDASFSAISCGGEAEALALAFAMRWCDLAARKPTLIEVDSSVLVHLILNHEAPIPWKIRQSIFTIRKLLSSWSSSIAHSYRETNKVADSLASFGCNLLSPSVFFTPISLPPSVISSLLYDWRGLLTPRLSS
ncbi:uncharacterized protein LOC116016235 [Ipomoea triloba]|uniref:uncharacterized protein LOC116016235 n=2 Tax=Ipomoea triloba TaxID=35885 RepID=UPI00125E943E|nr:uncharacterized protein LOC116016235 [Ipomoea triloba]